MEILTLRRDFRENRRQTSTEEKIVREDGNQRKDASAKYQEDCREVKRVCRTDKRDYANNLAAEAETAARLGDLKALHSISKKLSGRLQNKDRPVRKLLKTVDKELKRWKEHFEEVFNCPDPEDLPISNQGQTCPLTWVASQKKFLVVLNWVTRQAFGPTARGIQWHLLKRLEDLEYKDDLALLANTSVWNAETSMENFFYVTHDKTEDLFVYIRSLLP